MIRIVLIFIVLATFLLVMMTPHYFWPWFVLGAMVAWLISTFLTKNKTRIFLALNVACFLVITSHVAWREYVPHNPVVSGFTRVEIYDVHDFPMTKPLAVIENEADLANLHEFFSKVRIVTSSKIATKYKVKLISRNVSQYYTVAGDGFGRIGLSSSRVQDFYMPYKPGLGEYIEDLVKKI